MRIEKTYEGFLNKDKFSFDDYCYHLLSELVILLTGTNLKIKQKIIKDCLDVSIEYNNNIIITINIFLNSAKTLSKMFSDKIINKSYTFYNNESVFNYIRKFLTDYNNEIFIKDLINYLINKKLLNNISILPINTGMYDYLTEYLLNINKKYIQYINLNNCSDNIRQKYEYILKAINFDLI